MLAKPIIAYFSKNQFLRMLSLRRDSIRFVTLFSGIKLFYFDFIFFLYIGLNCGNKYLIVFFGLKTIRYIKSFPTSVGMNRVAKVRSHLQATVPRDARG